MQVGPVSRQDTYYHVYRGRQAWIYHLAYMRIAKVRGLLFAIEELGIDLAEKSIFDFAFGAGTFFRHCPKTSALFGVELDPVSVESVRESLARKGYSPVRLAAIGEHEWAQHELLNQSYDLVIASHVLEHLPEPESTLRKLVSCLGKDGLLVGALPVNERVVHENHEWSIDRARVHQWASAAGAEVVGYWEVDRLSYCVLPIFHWRSAIGRIVAQAASLALGIPAACMTTQQWHRLDKWIEKVTGAKAGQAVFVLKPR